MNLSEFSVNRPIFTSMAILIIMLLGSISFMHLPIDLLPAITAPILSVSTKYEKAKPEEVETMITRNIEQAVSAVPGVENISSVSSEGNSRVRIEFAWGTDLDAAANDIRDRIDRVSQRLPDDCDRPRLRKFDLASFPILICGAASSLDPVQLLKLIEDQIKYRIERIPGIASLDVRGGAKREIHVNIDNEKILSLNIPLEQIIKKLKDENMNLSAGTIEKGNYELSIRTIGEFTGLNQLKQTIIGENDGKLIKLENIAEIKDHWEKKQRIVRVNGEPGIRFSISKQAGKNTVEVANAALKEIKKINQDFPQIKIIPIIDTSKYIKRSIKNVSSAAFYGGLLSVLVLLFFLGNIYSTIIISSAIPISIIATFGLMYYYGFTINIMSLGGLALGIGMLVDNAIVVLENIFRTIEEGNNLKTAAIKGSAEVTTAIIASTLTTLAIFLPLIFMQGMTGIMFKQLSYIVGFSLFCSLIVSLTLVPMLASKFLKIKNKKKNNIFFNFIAYMETLYINSLKVSLIYKKWVILTVILILIGCLYLTPFIGKELMPTADEGEVRVNVEMELGTKLDVMKKQFFKIEKIVQKVVPEIDNYVTRIGGSSWRGTGSNTGEFRISLVENNKRKKSSEQIAKLLRKKLSGIPGVKVRTRAGQGLFIFKRMSPDLEKVQLEIRGHNFEKADKLAAAVTKAISDIDGITDVRISREAGNPERIIEIDRLKAADLKLTISKIANVLQTILAGTSAGFFKESGDEYKILVKVKNAEKMDIEKILNLTVINTNGEPVVLRNIVNVKINRGPVLIERMNQERVINITANTSDRPLGSIIDDVKDKLSTIPNPSGFNVIISGDFEEQQKSFRQLLISFILAIILVYMVMACQYESLSDPFIVMFSVPLACIGVILMLIITKTTFNIQTFIGCIMLGGIVVNNAILLVDQINLLFRQQKMELTKAIIEAGKRRFRPILMTALTTILGLVPLAIGIGEGGEVQAPLARAVIGGLFSSTLITLVFIPIIYMIFHNKSKKEHNNE